MIMQNALLLLVAVALQTAASDSSPPPHILLECGMSEEQVLELAVPDFRKKMTLSKAHEHDELNDYQFRAKLATSLTTDLGSPGSSFFVVVVAITYGYCDCCHGGRLTVIDLAKRRVVWSAETDGAVGPDWIKPSKQLRVFRLFPDDPLVTLAVRSSTPCGGGGGGAEIETWYQPRRNNVGDLQFERMWHGDLEYGYSGRRGGRWSEGCAEIQSLWPRRAYIYVVHELAGWIDKTLTARDPFKTIERPCTNADDNFGAVDFVSTSLLTPGQIVAGLGANAPPKLARRNLQPTVTFPFNLPVRRLFADVRQLQRSDTAKHALSVPSPDGTLVVGADKDEWPSRYTLQIRRVVKPTVLRQIPDPAWVDANRRPNEYGGYSFPWVGWTPDSRRCLAVVEVGLRFGPVLVSLTPDGKGDAWEGLLPRGQDVLGDGFILDLLDPAPAPESASTKHQ